MAGAKKLDLMTNTAVELLGILGCDEDPVTVLARNTNFASGIETDVRSLDEFQILSGPHTAKYSSHEIPAVNVRIAFYDGKRQVAGTLLGLLRDRLALYRGLP